ncbi:MAG TPA: hypothetical protein PK157_08230 [Bryobacteraceae bacterium]|nr:hypothetical protein [Bryobacteraceae bacterium]
MCPPRSAASPRQAIVAGFRPEFLDFDRGIRVGNLEEHERITRILKTALETRYGQAFVTERWGRGVYWKWIGFLTRANRAAKPLSSGVSFGCSKFYLSIEHDERIFQCGLQIERGFLKAPRESEPFRLREDWDWNRLLAALKPRGAMDAHLRRLLADGFRIHAGTWDGNALDCGEPDYPGPQKLRRRLETAAPDCWAGFQLYFPMTEDEVRGATGLDLVESMLAVFDEVAPVMNLCMQVPLPLKENSERPVFVEPRA